jgi:hypothetical protein
MPLPPLLREAIHTLGRIGVRAVAKGAESVLDDIGTVADNVSKKTKRAKSGLGKIPHEWRDDDG